MQTSPNQWHLRPSVGDKIYLTPLPECPVATVKRTLDELSALGEAIFDRQVRPALRREDDGKYVAIDVDTSDYELDADDYAAVTRLRSRRPAADIWLMRVGFPVTYRMGAMR